MVWHQRFASATLEKVDDVTKGCVLEAARFAILHVFVTGTIDFYDARRGPLKPFVGRQYPSISLEVTGTGWHNLHRWAYVLGVPARRRYYKVATTSPLAALSSASACAFCSRENACTTTALRPSPSAAYTLLM